MYLGEIPDSDVEIPPLVSDSPVWIPLGASMSEVSGFKVPNSPPQSSVQSSSIVNDHLVSLRMSKEVASNGDNEIAVEGGGSEAVDPASPALNQPLEEPDVSNLPRRRRFDFSAYVENDKKVHEYIYQRRFKDYHGPASDTEDDDFNIPDTQEEIEPFETAETQDTIEDDESFNESDATSAVPRSTRTRRQRVIESDSESDVDHPLVEKRLRETIPAVQDPESLESIEEAAEDFGGIDYMQPRTRRTRSSYNVVELAKHAGRNAPHTLLIAARTARSRKNRSSIRSTGQLTTERSKRTQKSPIEPSRSQKKLPAKLFANQSPEALQVLRRMSRGDLDYNHILPSDANKRTRNKESGSASMKPKKSRKRSTRENFNGYTSILEEEVGHLTRSNSPLNTKGPNGTRHSVSKRNFNGISLVDHESDIRSSSKNSSCTSVNRGIQRHKHPVKVSVESPARHILHSRFGKTTFVGSHLFDLFEDPSMWSISEAVPIPSGFGTPISESSDEQIAGDAHLILMIAENSDRPLYDELYSYFLAGTGYLCDERNIVQLSKKSFTAREWRRLARHLLELSRKSSAKRCNASKSQWLACISLLVTEASFILSQHVGLYESSVSEKGKKLALWTLFYLQDLVSLQIDKVDLSTAIGAELVWTVIKFQAYDSTLPRMIKKVHLPEPHWHLFVVLTSCKYDGKKPWHNWDLVNDLLNLTIHMDPFKVMLYIHRLLVYWQWPVSPDTIIDLFNFFAKQGYYADPKGETIGLPQFLLTSAFDGSNIPRDSFSLFLELLGFTLRKLKTGKYDDYSISPIILMRRFISRVTPLSALSFPEYREVTVSDLSSASHQFGLLILLFRILDEEMRPPVAQFRDLLVLRHTHWAMRVKAISAWSIVIKLTSKIEDRSECRHWMLDILNGGAFSDQVVTYALNKVLEHWRSDVVPSFRLAELGLQSNLSATRKKAWELISLARLSEAQLVQLTQWQHHFTDNIDLHAIVLVLGQFHHNPELIHKWTSQQNPNRARLAYAKLLDSGILKQDELTKISSYIIEASLTPYITVDDIRLLSAAKLTDNAAESAIKLGSLERRTILRKLITVMKSSEDCCSLALKIVADWSQKLKNDLPETAAMLSLYLPLASELRRLIQPLYPDLVKLFPLLDESSHVLETIQTNILSLLDNEKNDSTCYYFFIYRLRSLLPSSGEPLARDRRHYQKLDDLQYVHEVKAALQITMSPSKDQQMTVILLHLYRRIFALAHESLSQSRKNCILLILPTLIRSARAVTSMKPSLADSTGEFLAGVAWYLQQLLINHSDRLWDSFTLTLIEEFSISGTRWLNQCASLSDSPVLPQFFKPVMDAVEILLDMFEVQVFPAKEIPPLEQIDDPNLRGNLLAAFKTNTIIEDRIEPDSKDYKELRRFYRNLEVFISAYAPDD